MALKSESTSFETFRKLTKNDVYQTVDQWRERTLHYLGSVSGLWTAYVEKDDIPAIPEVRPELFVIYDSYLCVHCYCLPYIFFIAHSVYAKGGFSLCGRRFKIPLAVCGVTARRASFPSTVS